MKLIKTEEAVGSVLCHDITQIIPGVVKDAVFRKGHVVTQEDIPVLLSVGKEHLYVWEKQEGMLHENEAAEVLRRVCQGRFLKASKPKEGKIELTAETDGLLKVDKEKLNAVNGLGQIVIASRHGNFPVKKGDKVAGMRVVPLVIEEEKMEQVNRMCGNEPIFTILPFCQMKAAVVTTGSEVYHGRIEDKFTPVVKEKLRECGMEVIGDTLCSDDADMVTEAVKKWIEQGAELVVCTGGMSVDPDDRTPLAIRNAADEVITYGAPVLPGAMFMLAYFPELQFRKIGRKINHKRNERKIFGGSKMRTGIQEELELYMSKSVAQASNREIYEALLLFVQKLAAGKERAAGKKKLYYISAEFLIGKLLSNNMINLGIYDEVKEMLFQNGKDICQIEEVEPEPSLGNGGLGRLAACFLDSIATLGLPGDGIGLNYHLGLFKQEFKDHLQKELPNPWIEKQSWLTKTDVVYPVSFRGLKVNARMYDIAVTGYHDQTNKLHLFDIDSVDEGIVEDGIHFDKEDIAKNLTLFLYPDDSDEKGRLLRIYQQYFMVSSAAQMILDECVQKGSTLYDLPDYAVIQINDTHPTMVIPELIRLLVERGLDIDEAIDVVSRTCAYTNHTILVEALEKWPIGYLKKVVPQLVPIIEI